MKNLDFLLSSEEPVAKKERARAIRDVQITQYVLDRAFTYAELVCDVHRRELECIGYLIAPKNSGDRIARDAYLPREQEVSGASVKLSAEDVIKAGREIDNMGYRVLGWWHSHAGFHTFHSGIDDDNQMTVLNEIAPINYISEKKERIITGLETQVENGNFFLIDRKNNARYEIKTPNQDININELKIIEEVKTGFAYSLVVNNTKSWGILGRKKKREREPYTEIAIREFCPDCRKTHDKSEKAEIRIFPEIGIINEEEMKQEVKDRVKLYIPKYFGFGKGKKRRYGVYSPDDYEDGYSGVYSGYGSCSGSKQGLLFGKNPIKSQQSILEQNNKKRTKTPEQENHKQIDNEVDNGKNKPNDSEETQEAEDGKWEI